MKRPRGWVWLQLVIGWLPVWALYSTLIITAHAPTSILVAGFVAARAIAAAAVLGLLVYRLTERVPWPRSVTVGFVALHLAAAAGYAVGWVGLISVMESIIRSHIVVVTSPMGLSPFLILGVWFYVMVAGVAYATQAAERAARAEAIAAKSQLAALRSQLNPHFLFNALHAVVQLIPIDPDRASQAAEQLAGLLRTTVEEDRDLVTVGEERAFVERYLALERIRFGDRLKVRIDVDPGADDATIPSFALLTLVENAVRHGAAPRIEGTEIVIAGRSRPNGLELSVRDNGDGVDPDRIGKSVGTGLGRLRERLAVLYGGRARLEIASRVGDGFTASLVIPQDGGDGVAGDGADR